MNQPVRNVELSTPINPWLVAAVVVLLIIAVLSFTSPFHVTTIVLAMLTAAVAWFAVVVRDHLHRWDAVVRALPVSFNLARVPALFESYAKIEKALGQIIDHSDPLFRELAIGRLEVIAADAESLGQGTILFEATETWRTAYQRVLETLRVKNYYSVAWVRTMDYWNDAPGRQSMQVNYDLVKRGFRIERVHILADDVWPFEAKLPSGGLLDWLVEQQDRGIHVSLVRERDLANEPDLLRDFAIYGDRATGTQDLDEGGRTREFALSFDPQVHRQAMERWERLKLFSVSFSSLLDRIGSR